jgi:NAD(P)-dependent dehydrogenase (short-subunit alcohol dehydrogenase family)
MKNLSGKQVAIVGASQGVGREMVLAAAKAGADVLAVARREGPLAALAAGLLGLRILAADMADEATPVRILATMLPDVLVVCGGATPTVAPLQDPCTGSRPTCA